MLVCMPQTVQCACFFARASASASVAVHAQHGALPCGAGRVALRGAVPQRGRAGRGGGGARLHRPRLHHRLALVRRARTAPHARCARRPPPPSCMCGACMTHMFLSLSRARTHAHAAPPAGRTPRPHAGPRLTGAHAGTAPCMFHTRDRPTGLAVPGYEAAKHHAQGHHMVEWSLGV